MKIHTLTVGAFESNCYLVEEGDARLVIDPGADARQVLVRLSAEPCAVLLTHGHIDHLSALPALVEAWPALPVFLHSDDLDWAFDPLNAIPPYAPVALNPERLHSLPPHRWSAGPFSFEILPAPGHTPGGVCFHDPQAGVVFTGDTLFEGTIGRTDLPGADPLAMTDSLRRLARLPEDTRVYPGHGSPTTIGRELRHNYFLEMAARGDSRCEPR